MDRRHHRARRISTKFRESYPRHSSAGAKECSPRREPWVTVENAISPGGAKERLSVPKTEKPLETSLKRLLEIPGVCESGAGTLIGKARPAASYPLASVSFSSLPSSWLPLKNPPVSDGRLSVNLARTRKANPTCSRAQPYDPRYCGSCAQESIEILKIVVGRWSWSLVVSRWQNPACC
jgi:hypothetical protein